MKKFFYILLSFILLLPLIGLLATHFYMTQILIPEIQLAEVGPFKRYRTKVLEDLKILSQNRLFPSLTFQKDAGPFLLKHVNWGDSEHPSKVRDIAKNYPELDCYCNKHFNSLLRDPKIIELDLTWVDKLQDYDHIKLTARPQTLEMLKNLKKSDPRTKIKNYDLPPLPSLKELYFAGIFRFVQLHQQGRSVEGLAHLRKISQLLYSIPDQVASLEAFRLLNREYLIINHFKIQGWKTIDKNLLKTHKRVTWATPGIISSLFWTGLDPEIAPYLKPQYGFCAGVAQNAFGLGHEEYLKPQFPLEPDFSLQLKQSHQIRKQLFEACGMNDYKGLLNNDAPKDFKETQMPFVRRSIALVLMSIGHPDWFKLYKQE